MKPKKILIVKIAGIGDVIMALSLLREVRRRYPGAEVAWVVGKAGKGILSHIPLEHVVVVDDRAILHGSFAEKVRAVLAAWKLLWLRRYDLVFIPYHNKKYKALIWPVRAGEVRMFGKDAAGRGIPIPGRKFIDEYARLVHGRDADGMEKENSVQLDFAHAQNPFRGLWDNRRPIVVLSPGGFEHLADSHLAVRQWPIASYVALAEKLLGCGVHVAVTGAASEGWISRSFAHLPVQDDVGKVDLSALLAMYHYADLVITHDSGSLHMAGLSGTALLGLFGPTDPRTFMPRGENMFFLWHRDAYPCCPCYDGVNMAPCGDNRCMREISVSEVFGKVKEILPNLGEPTNG